MSGVTLSLILSYVSVTFLLVITPGASTAVVIRSALVGGSRGGVTTAAGAAVANSLHAVAVGLGVSLLLQRLPWVLLAIRLAGAGYLGWLSIASFRRAWRPSSNPLSGLDTTSPRDGSAFRQGLMTNLLNPPIITFYLVLPTFLPPSAGLLAFGLLAAIHVSMAFVVHTAWAVSFARLRDVFTRRSARRALDIGAGVALLLFAGWTVSKVWSA
ncbi:MAG TPA: LysE family translocator [Vicinamibacterales bacterium]|nr:LysE family translocator [Vicinamibacterales bacterium]